MCIYPPKMLIKTNIDDLCYRCLETACLYFKNVNNINVKMTNYYPLCAVFPFMLYKSVFWRVIGCFWRIKKAMTGSRGRCMCSYIGIAQEFHVVYLL